MLYNITDAWEDGFLRECVEAGPSHCALAQTTSSSRVTLQSLKTRMEDLLEPMKSTPLIGYLPQSGPSILTYSTLIEMLFMMLYDSSKWPSYAQMLYELESGNTTLALLEMEKTWQFDPSNEDDWKKKPSSEELMMAVVCDDGYLSHKDEPRSLEYWGEIQRNMTKE